MSLMSYNEVVYDFPSRDRRPEITGSEVARLHSGNNATQGKYLRFSGIDHNECPLMIEQFRRMAHPDLPIALVNCDQHSDINNFSYDPGHCYLGSWVRNVHRQGTIAKEDGLYWLFRSDGSVPYGFKDKSQVVPDFDHSGIRVNAICLDTFGQDPAGQEIMDELAFKVNSKKRLLGLSIDWDAGMRNRPNPYVVDALGFTPDFYDHSQMRQYLNFSEQCGAYDRDITRSAALQSLLQMAGFVMTFRSPEFCYPPYADYCEKNLR